MITPNSNPVLAGSPREGRASSTGARPEHHDCIGHHGPVLSKALDKFGDDFADQPGLVVFARVNGTVEPFQYIRFGAFHGDSCGV